MWKQVLVFGLVAVIASWAVASQAAIIGLWEFNEKAVGQNGANGDTVLDSSGSANVHNGTISTDASDDVPYVTGFGNSPALQFEETTSYDCIAVDGHADFTSSSSGSFTIEARIKTTQQSSSGSTPSRFMAASPCVTDILEMLSRAPERSSGVAGVAGSLSCRLRRSSMALQARSTSPSAAPA